MKKILIVAVLFGAALSPALAQFKQGTILVGGSLSGSFTTNKDKSGNTTVTESTNNTFTFQPQAGYFVLDNFALGAGIGLTSDKTTSKFNTQDKDINTSTSFNPFARYYYNKFFFQPMLQVGSGNNKTESVDGTYDNKYSLFGYNLGIGYAILINEHIAVEPLIGYSHIASKYKGASDKTINEGLFIQIGFQIYLNR